MFADLGLPVLQKIIERITDYAYQVCSSWGKHETIHQIKVVLLISAILENGIKYNQTSMTYKKCKHTANPTQVRSKAEVSKPSHTWKLKQHLERNTNKHLIETKQTGDRKT
jgi:hypothetical protein